MIVIAFFESAWQAIPGGRKCMGHAVKLGTFYVFDSEGGAFVRLGQLIQR